VGESIRFLHKPIKAYYMNFFAEVTKSNIDDYLRDYSIIVCKIRNSRLKAKQIAVLEMIFAQIDNEILLIKNGPLGDIKGIISFFCPKKNMESFKDRLFGIGYCYKFYLLDFENESKAVPAGLDTINPLIWKGRKFSVCDFYCQDNNVYEEQSPQKREFKINSDGEIKTITGYRGNGSELGKRALPVEDARCMVNLSLPSKNKKALDPFAGAGGIVYQFKYIAPDGNITSIDIDPVLKPGLDYYASAHYVMNVNDASFAKNSFDSVITETPFSEKAVDDIIAAFSKIDSWLSDDGIFVIMCGKNQCLRIYSSMARKNVLLFSHEIDRKGMDVEISIWRKNKNFLSGIEDFISALKKIY
jgi:hypothetical protein